VYRKGGAMNSFYICEDALCNKKYAEKPEGCRCTCGRYCIFQMKTGIVNDKNIPVARKNINPTRR
jgi:hypothetical protein